MKRGSSNHLENLKVKVYMMIPSTSTLLNTQKSQSSLILEFEMPEIEDSVIHGNIIGVDITRKNCCLLCNADMPEEDDDDEMVTCTNC